MNQVQRALGDTHGTSRNLLALPVLLLLLAALASNIYLAHLYLRVHQSPGQSVDSFCNVTQTVNCANVSATRYAQFLGVPLAVYGAEFYALATLVLLLSLTKRWPLESWESLIFWAMVAALPVSAVMAYISAFVIRMLCPLCSVVYGVNVVTLLLIVIVRRGAFGKLLRAGPRELHRALSKGSLRVGIAILLFAGISQIFWVPRLFGRPIPSSRQRAGSGETPAFPEGGRVVGPAGAPVEIVEFSDFQCSICSHAHEIIVQVLKQARGRVRFRHFDFPLDMACNRMVTRPFHGDACRAAYFALCADEQQRFWPFAARVFANQHHLTRAKLRQMAEEVELDVNRLQRCVNAQTTRSTVLSEIEEGIRREVRGTPTFFINGEKVVGPRDVNFWLRKIDALSAGSANAETR